MIHVQLLNSRLLTCNELYAVCLSFTRKELLYNFNISTWSQLFCSVIYHHYCTPEARSLCCITYYKHWSLLIKSTIYDKKQWSGCGTDWKCFTVKAPMQTNLCKSCNCSHYLLWKILFAHQNLGITLLKYYSYLKEQQIAFQLCLFITHDKTILF